MTVVEPTGPVERIGYVLRRAVTMELGVWQSLYRFLFRRPKVPPGAVGFSYHRPILTILLVFIVLSAVEIPIIDLIVHPWPWIRIPLLALGIWGLTWMLGLLLGYLTRPHSVGPDGIRVRDGAEVDIDLRWELINSVARRKLVAEPKAPRYSDESGIATLNLRIQDETNIEIDFERPVTIRIPQGQYVVSRLRIWVDDPDRFLSTVRPLLTGFDNHYQ